MPNPLALFSDAKGLPLVGQIFNQVPTIFPRQAAQFTWSGRIVSKNQDFSMFTKHARSPQGRPRTTHAPCIDLHHLIFQKDFSARVRSAAPAPRQIPVLS